MDMKDIRIGKKTPSFADKKGINLAAREGAGKNTVYLAAGVAVAGIALICLVKFGVLDQYAKLAEVRNQLADLQTQETALETKLAGYSDLQVEYRTCSTDWMSAAEGEEVLVDRQLVLDMVEGKMRTRGHVSSISLGGNQLNVSMSGMDLAEISEMFNDLQTEDFVVSCTLNLAETDTESTAATTVAVDGTVTTEEKKADGGLSFSVTIALQDPDAAAEAPAETAEEEAAE